MDRLDMSLEQNAIWPGFEKKLAHTILPFFFWEIFVPLLFYFFYFFLINPSKITATTRKKLRKKETKLFKC